MKQLAVGTLRINIKGDRGVLPKVRQITCPKGSPVLKGKKGFLRAGWLHAGVNDFSISLDACCAAFGDKMSGGVVGSWNRVTENIRKISKLSYVTLGVVVTEETVSELADTINFAASLSSWHKNYIFSSI